VTKKQEVPFPLRTKPRAYAAAPPALVIVASTSVGVLVLPFPKSKLARIGRAADCDVVIDDESVSRNHAAIDAREETLVVEDIGSTNGTLASGHHLMHGQRAELAVGAPFAVGAATIYVLHASATAATTARIPPSPIAGPVVRDPAMQRVYALLDVVAPSPLSVLILGETGVGKEVFAEAIHRRSKRRDRNLLKLNCAALPESILEAELFGYEKGAFTGATSAKQGLFEAANGGTVMLDEIGDLPLLTQAKLLRVLETGEVLRVGSVKTTTVDVRFVSATNVDLEARVAEGKFRSDLYFRLDGISIVLPPLRDRPADVLPLAEMFAARVAQQLARPTPKLAAASATLLESHAWPGNVRELRNVMERAVVLCAGASTIEPMHLTSLASSSAAPSSSSSLKGDLAAIERDRILRTLDEVGGNQTRAAKLLGISRHALLDRLDRYGIARPRKGK
jgi:transcriptional regulator with PAS, ATPase and Fis domain